jgi:DNA-binding beta-propeller fold protein YncE
MDQERFDQLARGLATGATRRGIVRNLTGAAIGAVLAAVWSSEAGARKKAKKRRHGKHAANGKGKGKGKERTAKGRKAQPARVKAAACCSSGNCTPGKGKNLGKCCYQNQNLTGKNFSGANLSSANFSGATLTNANLQGANLGKACLVDSILTGAKLNGSTNLAGAIMCRTQTNTGENNSGCGKGTPCCPTCDEESPCDDGEVCCNGVCRSGDCCTDANCPANKPICVANNCRPCSANSQCPSNICCNGICCLNGQTCVQGQCSNACPQVRPNRCADGSCQVCCNDNQCPTDAAPICGPNRTCVPCSSPTECSDAGKGNRCCSGQCESGDCCANRDCPQDMPICDNNTCSPCIDDQCGEGEICCAGACQAGNCCPISGPDAGDAETCTSNENCCATGCIDSNNLNNCGECGRACPNEICRVRTCVNGQCGFDLVPNGDQGFDCDAEAEFCCGGSCCTEGQVCDTRPNPEVCCTPEPKNQTCRPAGGPQRCGISVVNNCGQPVNCGDCDELTCQRSNCNGAPNGICQYTDVFGATGPNCPTVCCRDAQGDPVCCEPGIEICSSEGLCGCGGVNDCGANEFCCNGRCLANALCCDDDPSTCPDPGVCKVKACNAEGACVPRNDAPGTHCTVSDDLGVCCGGECLVDDPNNCTACGTACPANVCEIATCHNRACGITEINDAQDEGCNADGFLCCDGSCKDTNTDEANCGGCAPPNGDGDVCPVPSEECVEGDCVCAAGFKPCGPICIPNASCCTGTTEGCSNPTPHCCVVNGNSVCRECCDADQCPDETCQTKSCGVSGSCAYAPVFGDDGPGCDTICCQDAQGAPVCCAAGTTLCRSSGICGCADCEPGQVCCAGTCQTPLWANQTTFGSTGSGASQFRLPRGVAVAPDGLTVWVADQLNARVSIWTRPDPTSDAWANSTTFGASGGGAGQLSNPDGVAVAPDALTVWVADRGNARVSVWTRPDAASTAWTNATTFGSTGSGTSQFNSPRGVAVEPDGLTVWVGDFFNHRVSVWTRPDAASTAWANATTFGSQGSGASQFSGPAGVAVAPDGLAVWIGDQLNARVSVWTRPDATSTAWTNQTTFGSFGEGTDQFDNPVAVAVTADSLTVWVADQLNARISVWTRPSAASTAWASATTFGSRGGGTDQFDNPLGVAVAPDGRTIWVADPLNERISVWELGCMG